MLYLHNNVQDMYMSFKGIRQSRHTYIIVSTITWITKYNVQFNHFDDSQFSFSFIGFLVYEKSLLKSRLISLYFNISEKWIQSFHFNYIAHVGCVVLNLFYSRGRIFVFKYHFIPSLFTNNGCDYCMPFL